ncbi:MAG: MarR family transcriptional regulator, partial [Methanosarcina mazei]
MAESLNEKEIETLIRILGKVR